MSRQRNAIVAVLGIWLALSHTMISLGNDKKHLGDQIICSRLGSPLIDELLKLYGNMQAPWNDIWAPGYSRDLIERFGEEEVWDAISYINNSVFKQARIDELTQTLLKLPFMGRIPYPSRHMKAEDFVTALIRHARARERSLPPPKKTVPLNLFDSAQIMIHFKEDWPYPFFDEGLFNIHQPGHSGSNGWDFKQLRARVEEIFLGLSFPMNTNTESWFPSAEVRPKSGLLYIDAPVSLGEYTDDVATQYGGAAAVLVPETKVRTIWSTGDSLDIANAVFYSTESPANKEAFLNSRRGTFFRRDFPIVESEQLYLESLTYGPITPDHVDHFTLTSTKSLDKFQKNSHPVFLLSISRKYNRTWRTYKKLLHRGTRGLPRSIPQSEREKVLKFFK